MANHHCISNPCHICHPMHQSNYFGTMTGYMEQEIKKILDKLIEKGILQKKNSE